MTLASTATNASASDCNMKCNGDANELCGAGNRLTLYTRTAALPPQPSILAGNANYTFATCVQDSPRALTTQLASSSDMTIEKCLVLGNAYQFIGLEYSSECWAGDTWSNQVNASLSSCEMLCSGDDLQYCGGSSKLALYARNSTLPASAKPLVCYEDDVLRALEANNADARSFCPGYLAATTSGAMATQTVASYVSSFAKASVSSACSCFAITATSTATLASSTASSTSSTASSTSSSSSSTLV